MSEELIDHIHDDSGAWAVRRRRAYRLRVLLLWGVAAAVALGMSTSCATGGRGFGVRAAVDAGAVSEAAGGPGSGTWAAHQVRVVVLARGDAGWPTAVQGATVRAFDPSTSTLHEATTGPDGAVTFQSRGPLEMWVKLGEEDRPEVISWAPKPADDVGNQLSIVHTLGARP